MYVNHLKVHFWTISVIIKGVVAQPLMLPLHRCLVAFISFSSKFFTHQIIRISTGQPLLLVYS